MGCGAIQYTKPELNIATLNYSGIIASPYKFYETSQINNNQENQRKPKHIQTQFQDKITMDMYQKYQMCDQNESFQFGPFQQKWRQTRFSPLYNMTCGIKNQIFMMNQQQFRQQWNKNRQKQEAQLQKIYEQYQKATASHLKTKNKIKKMGFYLKKLQNFDFVVYQSILRNIYTQDDQLFQIDKKFQKNWEKNFDKKQLQKQQISKTFQLKAIKYRTNRKQKFQKSYFNQQNKTNKIIKFMDKMDLDILFVQQATKVFLKIIQNKKGNIRIVKSCEQTSYELKCKSAILIRQNPIKFPKLRSLRYENTRLNNNVNKLTDPKVQPKYLTSQQISKLNFGQNTVIQFLYNLILISTLFTGSLNQNEQLVKQLKQAYHFLKKIFPTCHIIIGGSLNSKQFLQQYTFYSQSKLYRFGPVPKTRYQYTTRKKLTKMQPYQQKQNSNNIFEQVSDYLISDLKIQDQKIMTIDRKILINCTQQKPNKDNLPFLPTHTHPYDHYLVVGKIVMQEPLQHIDDYSYRINYIPKTISSQEYKRNQIEDIKRKSKVQRKNYG